MDFLVLPDRPFTDADLGHFAHAAGGTVIPHASGRPWIVGQWVPDDVTLVTTGDRRLAVFGRTRFDTTEAARRLAVARSLYDLDPFVRRIPGAVHVLASMDGRTRTQGCVSTVRQVFYATVDGVTLAASGIGPLRKLSGAPIDTDALALRLLAPMGAPWPLSAGTFWTGVEPVPGGQWLETDEAGHARTHEWWRAPESTLPLVEAARAVREALVEAVDVRVHGRGTVSADLSGGLDSTCVSFVAAAAGADLVTFHVKPLDAANSDTVWAERAAAAMPGPRHRTVPADRPENLFGVHVEQGADGGQWEGPQLWTSGWGHLADLAQRAAAEGSAFHMMGLGGDELFGAIPAYLWSLWRRHPLRSLPTIRRSRLLNRWTWGDCLRGLRDRTTFAQALAALPDQLTGPPPRPPYLDFGWVPVSRIPPWVTADAAGTIQRVLREVAATGPRPLDADRTRHQILDAVLFEGAMVRQIRAASANGPVEWDAPLLDHRVVEAALSVRIEERAARGQYKPVFTEAMRGIVPDPILDRPDKGEFSAEMHEGLRRNQRALLAFCDDSRLADLGLIDAAALRARLLDPGPISHHLTALENTLACESWLRSAAVTSVRSPSASELRRPEVQAPRNLGPMGATL